jgi:hypothetical protein
MPCQPLAGRPQERRDGGRVEDLAPWRASSLLRPAVCRRPRLRSQPHRRGARAVARLSRATRAVGHHVRDPRGLGQYGERPSAQRAADPRHGYFPDQRELPTHVLRTPPPGRVLPGEAPVGMVSRDRSSAPLASPIVGFAMAGRFPPLDVEAVLVTCPPVLLRVQPLLRRQNRDRPHATRLRGGGEDTIENAIAVWHRYGALAHRNPRPSVRDIADVL